MEVICDTWSSCLVDRWWAIALTILASSTAIACADYLGINRPWYFSVALGGIVSLMIMEAYPYAWTLGDYTHIVLWILFSWMAYLLPQLATQPTETGHKTIWDYFEEVDSQPFAEQPTPKGASAWVDYS